MKKSELVIDEKIAVSLRSYYWDMLKKTDNYQQELSRAYVERKERSGINFRVFGKTLAIEDMLETQNFFLSKKPPNCQAELMFLLHEKDNLGGIKMILEGLEGFLRKLPGVKLPDSRPAAMDEMMRIKE